jgi:DNA-binding NarL/FixJ family response regulator
MTVAPADGELRVVVVADDHLAGAGLAAMIAGQPSMRLVGQVSAEAYVATSSEVFAADVVLWDLGWDTSTTLGRLEESTDGGPPAIALLQDDSAAADAWATGVRAMLSRDAAPETLLGAIAAVTQGLMVIDPSLEGAVLSGRGHGAEPADATLTARELQVLDLVARGLPNKSIARELSISDHTVKFHLNSILSKLGAQSRTDAVVRATRMGLITL